MKFWSNYLVKYWQRRLNSKDVQTRLKAIEKLAKYPDDSTIDLLVKLYKYGTPEERGASIVVLSKQGKKNLAIEYLGETFDDLSIKELLPLLTYYTRDEKELVLQILKKNENIDAVINYLKNSLKTKSLYGNMYNYHYLRMLGWVPATDEEKINNLIYGDFFKKPGDIKPLITQFGNKAFEPLISLIKMEGFPGNSGEIGEVVIKALGEMGDERAIDPIKECMSKYKDYSHIRYKAIDALEKINGNKAIDVLLDNYAIRDLEYRVRTSLKKIGFIAFEYLYDLQWSEVLNKKEVVEKAVIELRKNKELGNKTLLIFLKEYHRSRNTGIFWILDAISQFGLTQELEIAIKEIISDKPVRQGEIGYYNPEIFGENKVGYTDGTWERIIIDAKSIFENKSNI
jgi:HEAT repeat protein